MWIYSPPRLSFLSAFITSLSDQARISVSIKLCSLQDDIYVRGQLIFPHCNYRHRSVKHRRSCHMSSSYCPANQVWPSHQSWRPPRTRARLQMHIFSGESKVELYESLNTEDIPDNSFLVFLLETEIVLFLLAECIFWATIILYYPNISWIVIFLLPCNKLVVQKL